MPPFARITMKHPNRIFAVSEVRDLEVLLRLLRNAQTFICQGFRFEGLFFFNDAEEMMDPPEWVVFKTSGGEIGSIHPLELAGSDLEAAVTRFLLWEETLTDFAMPTWCNAAPSVPASR